MPKILMILLISIFSSLSTAVDVNSKIKQLGAPKAIQPLKGFMLVETEHKKFIVSEGTRFVIHSIEGSMKITDTVQGSEISINQLSAARNTLPLDKVFELQGKHAPQPQIKSSMPRRTIFTSYEDYLDRKDLIDQYPDIQVFVLDVKAKLCKGKCDKRTYLAKMKRLNQFLKRSESRFPMMVDHSDWSVTEVLL